MISNDMKHHTGWFEPGDKVRHQKSKLNEFINEEDFCFKQMEIKSQRENKKRTQKVPLMTRTERVRLSGRLDVCQTVASMPPVARHPLDWVDYFRCKTFVVFGYQTLVIIKGDSIGILPEFRLNIPGYSGRLSARILYSVYCGKAFCR